MDDSGVSFYKETGDLEYGALFLLKSNALASIEILLLGRYLGCHLDGLSMWNDYNKLLVIFGKRPVKIILFTYFMEVV